MKKQTNRIQNIKKAVRQTESLASDALLIVSKHQESFRKTAQSCAGLVDEAEADRLEELERKRFRSFDSSVCAKLNALLKILASFERADIRTVSAKADATFNRILLKKHFFVEVLCLLALMHPDPECREAFGDAVAELDQNSSNELLAAIRGLTDQASSLLTGEQGSGRASAQASKRGFQSAVQLPVLH